MNNTKIEPASARHVVSQALLVQPGPLEKQHASHLLFLLEPTAEDMIDPRSLRPGPQEVDETGASSCIISESVAHQEHREQASAPKVSCEVLLNMSVSVRDTLALSVFHHFKPGRHGISSRPTVVGATSL